MKSEHGLALGLAVVALLGYWIHCAYREPASQLDDPATQVNEEWLRAIEEGRRPEPRRESAWGSVPPFSWMEYLIPTPPARKRGELEAYVTGASSDASSQSGPMAENPYPDRWLGWLLPRWQGWPQPNPQCPPGS